MSDHAFHGRRHAREGGNRVTFERTPLGPRLRRDDGSLATIP